MDGRNERIVTRQHIVILLPDFLLFFASFVFWLLKRMLPYPDPEPVTVGVFCGGAALFFFAVGVVHIAKWFGFRVILTPTCVRVQRFWIFSQQYCVNNLDRRVVIHPLQDNCDERLNKGTLVIYETGSVVATLDNLGDFARISRLSALLMAG